MGNLVYLDTASLKRCPYSLRPVRKDSLEYLQFYGAIQRDGIYHPLLVRQGFQVVDGNYQWEIAKDLRIPQVPCYVKEMSDFDVLVKQLVLNNNASREEYSRRLWRIMQFKPEMSLDELAHTVGKAKEWLFSILRLDSLVDKDSLYNGSLPIIVAGELAKLPEDYQKELNNLIPLLTAADLCDTIRTSVRRFRESLKDGRASRNLQTQLDLSPRFRVYREVKAELEEPSAAVSILHSRDANTPLEGWRACLEWVLKVDAESLAKRQAQFDRLLRKGNR